MQLTSQNWKAFSNWREEALLAMKRSEEFKDIQSQISEKEATFYQKIEKKTKFLFVEMTDYAIPPIHVQQERQFDLKILYSKRDALLSRVPDRTVEGFFDWAFMYAEKED